MNETFVTYEQAQALKRLGFDWECGHFWHKEFTDSDKMVLRQASADDFNHDDWDVPHCSAPRIDQAAKWLREVKGIDIDIPPVLEVSPEKIKIYNLYLCYFSKTKVGYMNNYDRVGEGFADYESALSVGIDKALELLEKGG